MYDLVGVDGNAFSVMGYVQKAMKECHFTSDHINMYMEKATSGDYNNLLRVSVEMIDWCNMVKDGITTAEWCMVDY